MKARIQTRIISMILIGVSCLMIKHWLSAWLPNVVLSYLGNISASFAVFFLEQLAIDQQLNSFLSAFLSLFVVEIFELTDGYGVMSNVFDPWDYLANFFGILLALMVDRFFPYRNQTKQD